MKLTNIRTMAINPPHEVREPQKLSSLVSSMSAAGWLGRPLLVIPYGDGFRALTGSHRIEAAKATGMDTIPALCIEDSDLDADGWETLEAAMWDDECISAALTNLGLAEAAELMSLEIEAAV